MASLSPFGNDKDNGADHESNDSSKSPQQSPQEPGETDAGGDKIAMMMEPRLMLVAMSRDEVADSRQTLHDSSSSTFQTLIII